MKVILAVLFTIVVTSTVDASKLPKKKLLTREMPTNMQDTIRQSRCNLNLCFAIDGSSSISAEEFTRVQDFVEVIWAIVGSDEGSRFAATQFGEKSEPISRLTSNRRKFIKAVIEATPVGGTHTSIGAGIRFCDGQLARSFGNANKVVVITDRRNTIGEDPVVRADNFRRRDPNGDVCTVAIGSSDMAQLQAIAGGDPDKVLTLGEFFEVSTIAISLFNSLCGEN